MPARSPRRLRLGLLWSAALAFAALTTSAPDARADANWATARAEELCAQGESHRLSGDVAIAFERFRQAIEIDPTYGAAYLALGGLREATGDADEAERTYGAGIEHVAGFSDAFLARAALRLRAGRADDALADLLSAQALRPEDLDVTRKLRDASISLGRFPLALAESRKLAALASAEGDTKAEHEAQVTAMALAQLVGFADPVVDGEARNAVRRALASNATPRRAHASRAPSSPGASHPVKAK